MSLLFAAKMSFLCVDVGAGEGRRRGEEAAPVAAPVAVAAAVEAESAEVESAAVTLKAELMTETKRRTTEMPPGVNGKLFSAEPAVDTLIAVWILKWKSSE